MFVISILSICTVAAFFPLGEDSIDDLGFSWLPTGRYSSIMHVDLDAMKKEEAWEVFSKHCDYEKNYEGFMELPESFGDYNKVTKATLIKYSIDREWVRSLEGNAITSLNSQMSTLLVFQYDDLGDLIDESLARDEIGETGEMYLDRKIYSYSRRVDSKAGGTLYGTASGTGEWLVAEKTELVKLMLACGYGSHQNILMNDNMDEVIELVEDLGHWWRLRMLGEERTIKLEALRQHDSNKERVEYMEEAFKEYPVYIARATLLKQGDIIEKQIFVFGDEKYARSMKDELVTSYEGQGEAEKRSNEYKRQKSIETIEGNKVIITYVLDEEMMRLENEAAKEWEEMKKKEQEEKAKEETKEPHAA